MLGMLVIILYIIRFCREICRAVCSLIILAICGFLTASVATPQVRWRIFDVFSRYPRCSVTIIVMAVVLLLNIWVPHQRVDADDYL